MGGAGARRHGGKSRQLKSAKQMPLLRKCLLAALLLASVQFAPRSRASSAATVGLYITTTIPEIYDKGTLQPLANPLNETAHRIIRDKVEPLVTDEQRALLEGKVQYDLEPDGSLFNCDSVAIKDNPWLRLPTSTAKFLSDLCYIEALKESTSFRYAPGIKNYIYILRYRRSKDFPQGRYPTPFEFYGIPHSALQEPDYSDPVLEKNYHLLYDSALVFLLAHEAHHLICGDHGVEGTAVTQEMDADDFGVTVLERSGTIPVGAECYFVWSSSWMDNVCDFAAKEEYENALEASGHPRNGDRISAIGRRILREPAAFALSFDSLNFSLDQIRQFGRTMVATGVAVNQVSENLDVRKLAYMEDLSICVPERKDLSQDSGNEKFASETSMERARAQFHSALGGIAQELVTLDEITSAYGAFIERLPKPQPDEISQELMVISAQIRCLSQIAQRIDAAVKSEVSDGNASNYPTDIKNLAEIDKTAEAFESEFLARAGENAKIDHDLEQIIAQMLAGNLEDGDRLNLTKRDLSSPNIYRELRREQRLLADTILSTMILAKTDAGIAGN